jgi:hypothetical protein
LTPRSIFSFVGHIIVVILAGIGSAATEWVIPVNRRNDSETP